MVQNDVGRWFARPPAAPACHPPVHLPSHPPTPHPPPVHPPIRVATRVRLSYSLYKVCTFLSCCGCGRGRRRLLRLLCFRWTVLELRWVDSTCRVLRDLFRDSTSLHSVSYVWKIKVCASNSTLFRSVSELFCDK